MQREVLREAFSFVRCAFVLAFAILGELLAARESDRGLKEASSDRIWYTE